MTKENNMEEGNGRYEEKGKVKERKGQKLGRENGREGEGRVIRKREEIVKQAEAEKGNGEERGKRSGGRRERRREESNTEKGRDREKGRGGTLGRRRGEREVEKRERRVIRRRNETDKKIEVE